MQNNTPKPSNVSHTNVDPIARRNARRLAIQALYQWHLVNTPIAEIEEEFLQDLQKHNPDKRLDLPYFLELLHSVPSHQTDLDREIEPFLTRRLQEVDPIELCVLRLGAYELMHRLEIHSSIIINEALELSKRFGGEDGHKFVNSILDKVARKMRVHEFN